MTDDSNPGDGAWIRAALDRYEGPLTRYAARLTGDLDRARDLVQETFLRLCRAGEGRVRARLPEWLYTVCRNRAIDVGRKESRMKPLAEGGAEKRASREPAPEEAAQQEELRGRVARLLATLSRKEQEVIRLKFQEGLSYREISRVTRLSVSHVGYLIHTGIRSVRRQLETGRDVARGADGWGGGAGAEGVLR